MVAGVAVARTRLVLIATDSWEQINGITTLYRAVIESLDRDFRGQCRLLVVHAADSTSESAIGYEHRVVAIAPRVRFRLPQYPELLTGYISSRQFAMLEQVHGNVDVVHVATQGLVGLSAARYARLHSKRCVGFYHTHWPAYVSAYLPKAVPPAARRWLGRALGERWDQLVYGGCSPIVVHTPRSEQWLSAGLKGRILCAPEFVDCRRFETSDPTAGRDRTAGEVVFGFVGRIAREKNLGSILRHADRIKRLGCRLVIVGDGPERSTLCRADADFVGWKSGAELTRQYKGMDFLLLPAESDTLGLVLLEAAACGVPAVALRGTVAGDCVSRYRSGVVVDAFCGDLFGELRAMARSEHFSKMRVAAKLLAADHDIRRGTATLLRAWSGDTLQEHADEP
jgi:glycosyltransferase involved in cell wall biosynthesis